jgi:anti-sigma-K factor RskA
MSDRIDISDYLLGELSGDELAEAESRYREDPSFRDEVDRLRPAVRQLDRLPDEAWLATQPPPLRVPTAETPDDVRSDRPRQTQRWWQGLLLRPAFAGVAAVALIAIGIAVGVLAAGGDPDPAPEGGDLLALEPVEPRGEDASGSARLVGGSGGEAVVEVSGVEQSAAGEFYELWLLSGPDELVSLGSFKVGASGEETVRVPLPVDPGEFEFVDISIEPDDGDGSHSGRSILRAPT